MTEPDLPEVTPDLVCVRELTVTFGDAVVVSGVSFDLRAGECLALVGESGSGKTLTSRSLLGLVPAPGVVSADTLEVAGQDVRSSTERQWESIRGSSVGLVSQDALVSLDPLRPIGAEVAEALEVRRLRAGQPLHREERRRTVVAELEHVAVPEPLQRMRQFAHQLSGGLRQRALIASATITRPQLLIADEPTTALDRGVQAQVLQVLGRLKDGGAGILMISHDLAVVATIADRVAVMRGGIVVETGPTDQVLGSPQHEYTRSLLRALPSAHSRGRRLSTQPRLDLPERDESVSPAPQPDQPLLSARRVTQTFRQPDGSRLTAVSEVSLDLYPGRTIGVVGESGSGKSTLGRILLGLQQPDSGEVLLDGEPWSSESERARRPRRHLVQAVHQDPLSSFDPRASVESILTEALGVSGVPRAQRRDRSTELLSWVGLAPDLLNRRPVTLSGGQRQRVAIARALARSPRILVCDEPVSALDASVQAQVLDAFVDIRDQLGLAMVFISHDLGVVHHLCDDVLVMKDGVVVERGTATDVFTRPEHPYTQSLLAALPELAQPDPIPTQE